MKAPQERSCEDGCPSITDWSSVFATARGFIKDGGQIQLMINDERQRTLHGSMGLMDHKGFDDLIDDDCIPIALVVDHL